MDSTVTTTGEGGFVMGALRRAAAALAMALAVAACSGPSPGAGGDGGGGEGDEAVDGARGAPLVIAHRGASGHAPEHTMAAYRLALEMGADYIEQDLQLTRDGVLVVLHDDSLRRTVRGPAGRCSGWVRERTLAELEACDAGSWFNEAHPERARPDYAGLRVPTLERVLEAFGSDARYYIEIKSPESAPGMEEALIGDLERAGLMPAGPEDRTVLVQSFSPTSLRRLHELQPSLPLVQLVPREGPAGPVDAYLERVAGYAVAVGPHHSLVDAALLRAARRHGLDVHPWTVNEEAEMRRLTDLGVDAIFTDLPDRLLRLLEGR